MYGLVNQAVEELITERFGRQAWQQIKTRAGVTEEVFVRMTPYPDAITFRLVGAASEVLAVPADQLLEAFGEYWTLYTGRNGYGELFERSGRTFEEFMPTGAWGLLRPRCSRLATVAGWVPGPLLWHPGSDRLEA